MQRLRSNKKNDTTYWIGDYSISPPLINRLKLLTHYMVYKR